LEQHSFAYTLAFSPILIAFGDGNNVGGGQYGKIKETKTTIISIT